jgi:hypothetical protein
MEQRCSRIRALFSSGRFPPVSPRLNFTQLVRAVVAHFRDKEVPLVALVVEVATQRER